MKSYLNSSEPYIIAETAYSYEGIKEYLLEQTLKLSSEVNAIKYHMLFNIDEYMVPTHHVYNNLNTWLLEPVEWEEILIKAKEKNLDTVILVDDIKSVEFCAKNSDLVDAIEIHAACVNDMNLLSQVIKFAKDNQKVFMIGISGFEIQELQDITEYLKVAGLKDVVLMYGFQNYPTKIEEINLSKISVLEEMLEYKIGYADHTAFSDPNKEQLITTAFSLGANIQEIHYVVDEGVERTDYITAVSSNRLVEIKSLLEVSYTAIGKPDFRLNQGEKNYLNFRKVPVYARDMKKGEFLNEQLVKYKRVESPLKRHRFREMDLHFGKALSYDVIKDSEISVKDLRSKSL